MWPGNGLITTALAAHTGAATSATRDVSTAWCVSDDVHRQRRRGRRARQQWQRTRDGNHWRHRRAGRAAVAMAATASEARTNCAPLEVAQGPVAGSYRLRSQQEQCQASGGAAGLPPGLDGAGADASWAGDVRPGELQHGGCGAAGGQERRRSKSREDEGARHAGTHTPAAGSEWTRRWLLWLALLHGAPTTAAAACNKPTPHKPVAQ